MLTQEFKDEITRTIRRLEGFTLSPMEVDDSYKEVCQVILGEMDRCLPCRGAFQTEERVQV